MRMPRILKDGALYHVTARANRKEMILESGSVKDLLLGIIKRAKRKFKFRIENFSIMGNHFHILIRPGRGASLSSIMQWILSVFAMSYNRTKALTGHVWGERFFSRIVEDFSEFVAVFGYIDENPLKSSQVARSRDWRHGGLWHDRTGVRDIIDESSVSVAIIFPEHGQLLLG